MDNTPRMKRPADDTCFDDNELSGGVSPHYCLPGWKLTCVWKMFFCHHKSDYFETKTWTSFLARKISAASRGNGTSPFPPAECPTLNWPSFQGKQCSKIWRLNANPTTPPKVARAALTVSILEMGLPPLVPPLLSGGTRKGPGHGSGWG